MENLNQASQQFLSFLLGAAIIHGLYLSVIIFFQNSKSTSSRLLAIVLISISLYLFNYLLFITGIIQSYPHLLGQFMPPVYLVGPAFYFFIQKSLQLEFKWKIIHLLHLLPFLYSIYQSVKILQLSTARKLAHIGQIYQPEGHFTWIDFLLGNTSVFLLLAYVGGAWLICRQFESKLTQINKSQTAGWLKRFCIAFFVLLVLDLAIKFSAFSLQLSVWVTEYILATLQSLAIHLLGYYSIGKLNGLAEVVIPNNKYQSSSLDEKQKELYRIQLLKLLEEQQPWLSPELKVADLANLLSIPSYQLSQLLNEGMQTSFSDLINHYRIQEIKMRLVHPDFNHYSILAIALDCGFTNKSTFNRVFKKLTGQTPTGFVKEINEGKIRE